MVFERDPGYRPCTIGLVLVVLLILTGCSSTTPLEKPDPLPEIEETVALEEVWSHSIGDGMDEQLLFLSPVIIDGTLYVIDAAGELFAIDPSSGEILWERELEERILAGVGGDRERLYVVGRNGDLIALDRKDGSELWRYGLPAESLAPPQSNGTQVVAVTIDGKLFGFDAETGEPIWQYDSVAPVLSYRGTATPYVDDRRVLMGFSNGMLMSFDVATGAPLWQYTVAVPSGRTELERLVDVDGRPLVVGDAVVVTGYQGKLAALGLDDGRELWSEDVSSLKSPGIGAGNVYVSATDGTLIAYNGYTRAESWRVEDLSWRRLTTPVPFGDFVTVGDFEGYLHLVRQSDGTLVGRELVDDEGLRVPPQRFQDLLIVYGNGGNLVAYRLPEDDG